MTTEFNLSKKWKVKIVKYRNRKDEPLKSGNGLDEINNIALIEIEKARE